MDSFTNFRLKLSTMTIWLSMSMTVVLLLNILWLIIATYSPNWLYHHHRSPWIHTYDRSIVRLFIDSWFAAILVFLVSLFGIGNQRRRSFILSASNVIGFPAILFAVVASEGLFRSLTTNH